MAQTLSDLAYHIAAKMAAGTTAIGGPVALIGAVVAMIALGAVMGDLSGNAEIEADERIEGGTFAEKEREASKEDCDREY